MSKTPKKALLELVIGLYDFHTKLFYNVIVDFTPKDAANRLGTKANHIGWLAGSLVQGRFELANFLGVNLKQTSDHLFSEHKGIQDNVEYPSLDEYRKDWELITPKLKEAMLNTSEEKWNEPEPWGMGMDLTLFDGFVFSMDRESYCIGQIALYRRLLGYPAMKYD
jgi:hypothetical protein